MRIHLIAIGTRLDQWVEQGYQEFAKRLSNECALQLIEIPAAKRSKNVNLEKAVREEGQRMLAAIPKGAYTIALEVNGRPYSTPQLAQQLEQWMHLGRDVALLVGGPEGLAPECAQGADTAWSLSPLTLPHPLVRIVLAEQLYRAWSIFKNHPYHR
ncbi:23S rRNA (pseudouridine(1915)-N(3))-methyltransferase RlmH [Kaarinaea lacus]